MEETTFKVGDVVQLKSGSPKMTISEIYGEFVILIFYVNDDIKSNRDIPLICLEKV